MKTETIKKSVEWTPSGVVMIDQTLLPKEYKTVTIKTCEEMYNAIADMIVRGAPAIGISGAHGVTLAAKEISQITSDKTEFDKLLKAKAEYLKSSRPTAVNLAWAVDIQLKTALDSDTIENAVRNLTENGIKLENEDIEINKKIGDFGAEIVPQGGTILTHCNAGALATVGYGTALGVVRSAHSKDPSVKVFADETRPRGQGAKLTTWELMRDGIDVTLITDGMSGYFMKKGIIDVVITGADRIAANGDSANKIGTYNLAIAAKYHNVPFYIAAPVSTIDPSTPTGEDIPIEERSHDEVRIVNGDFICPENVKVINPGFDVTSHDLIAGIITEKGILRPPFDKSIAKLFNI